MCCSLFKALQGFKHDMIPCMMVFIAFIVNMLFIPSMTQAIFGGAAGLAGSAAGFVGNALRTYSMTA